MAILFPNDVLVPFSQKSPFERHHHPHVAKRGIFHRSRNSILRLPDPSFLMALRMLSAGAGSNVLALCACGLNPRSPRRASALFNRKPHPSLWGFLQSPGSDPVHRGRIDSDIVRTVAARDHLNDRWIGDLESLDRSSLTRSHVCLCHLRSGCPLRTAPPWV